MKEILPGGALVFFLALALSVYLTPIFRDAARRFGIVDAPDGKLKRQKEPVPYLGGLAVFASILFPLSVVVAFSDKTAGILLGASVIVILGLIDDIGRLSPGIKFLVQVIAVFLLLKCGVRIRLEALPPLAAVGLTFLWMLLLINGFNLIDVMDGLAASVAVVAGCWLFSVLLLNGARTEALLALATVAALLGFLRLNRHPAQIYLGDTGSLLVGFLLGALAMEARYTEVNPLGFASAIFIFGIPIFEILFVTYVRRRRGIPVFSGSRDHVALRLRNWRLGVNQTVAWSAAAAVLAGGIGFGAMLLPLRYAAVLYALGAAGFLAVGAWLKSIKMTL